MGQSVERYYRQCLLARGTSRQRAWIPEELATNHAAIRIGDEDGWHIEHVSIIRRPESQVSAHERDYLRHRERVDI